MAVPELRTQRLLLRGWRAEDREPFARLNADPEVMRHFPSTLTREESDAFVDRNEERFSRNGFGLWAVEVPGAAPFLGLQESVSFTIPANLRSRAVMERLGMTWDPAGDFDHPGVPPGPFKRHVLYRIRRPVG